MQEGGKGRLPSSVCVAERQQLRVRAEGTERRCHVPAAARGSKRLPFAAAAHAPPAACLPAKMRGGHAVMPHTQQVGNTAARQQNSSPESLSADRDRIEVQREKNDRSPTRGQEHVQSRHMNRPNATTMPWGHTEPLSSESSKNKHQTANKQVSPRCLHSSRHHVHVCLFSRHACRFSAWSFVVAAACLEMDRDEYAALKRRRK